MSYTFARNYLVANYDYGRNRMHKLHKFFIVSVCDNQEY